MERKILLIDKNESYIESLKEQLLKDGFDVEIVNDVEDAYDKVFTFFPDLIISDFNVGELNALQFCKVLKFDNFFKKIPFLVLVENEVKSIDKYWAKKCDVQEILTKKLPFEELVLKVVELVDEYEINEKSKTKIKATVKSEESLQTQTLKLMRTELEQYAILNDFRNMVNDYYTDEKALTRNVFELLSVFWEYDLAGIFFNHAEESGKYILNFDVNNCSVSNFVLEKVKRDFFSKMPNIREFSITNFGHNVLNENIKNLENRIISANEFTSSLIIPFELEGKLVGGVCFYSRKKQDFSKLKFYKIIQNELNLLFKTSYLFSGIEFLSVTDGLTGLFNRRQFDYSIEGEFNKSRNYPFDLCFAILDIDHFKQVNDTHGHQYGDYVLKEVSSIIKNSLRTSDLLYRYGGEEIAIVMTETTIPNALTMLERLRKKIETYDFIFNGVKIDLTVSIGISSNLDRLEDAHQMIDCADKALYKAKETGRNKVVTYSDEYDE